MTVEQFISNLQESCINREIVLISDGNNCHIVEYDANLDVIYL